MDNELIRIGNQSAFITRTPLEPFLYAVDSRFSTFEWLPDKKEPGVGWDISDIPEEMRRHIKETACNHDITLSVHAPWWINPLLPEAAKILHDNIVFATNIGARLLNTHLVADAGVEPFTQALEPIIRSTHEAGLKLSLENTPSTTPEDFNRFFKWWQDHREIPTAHVGMCLDLGHANLCGATRNDYIRYLDQLGSHVPIIHVHLHENYGDQDSHLPIFTGPAGQNDTGVRGVIERLIKRGFSGSIILEQWPEPPGLLREARDRLMSIIGDYLPKQKPEAPPTPVVPQKTTTPPKAKRQSQRKTKAQKEAAVSDKKSDEEFVHALIVMNRQCSSWREKLDGVCDLLQDVTFQPTNENLSYIAIYLRFLGTGEIACIEDGRHFRPSHHARMSRQINEKLARFSTPDNSFILRKIYPWLPSFDSAFMRAEPLTRIRDIAHRNDIPKELKKEIKDTLQNKLHRCAGPEDLETSKTILQRITAVDNEFSSPFVEQFKIFHEELQEFFNATSLETRLAKIVAQVRGEPAVGAQRFLAAKKSMGSTADKRLGMLQLATELRNLLLNQVGSDTTSQAQSMRLADIDLENYAFVLLSEMIAHFETRKAVPWKQGLKALVLTVDNLRLSDIQPEENKAISSDLAAWSGSFDPAKREHLLRLKASLTRCHRLADTYSKMVLNLFFEKADKLGHALGIDEPAIGLYCEGDIRGNLIFQLSKLASLFLKNIRKAADLPPWDVIVAGTATGRLLTAKHLTELNTSADEDVLVLLENAEGDETVPKGVTGIILAHDLPHLSHLAIRTRQEGVLLLTGEDAGEIKTLKRHKGEFCMLSATAEAVIFKPAFRGKQKNKKQTAKQISVPNVEFATVPHPLELAQVSLNSGGGKAYGAQRLRTLARRPGAEFNTPRGLVIPFGIMEEALVAKPAVQKQYDKLLKRLAGLEGNDFIKTTEELADIVSALSVPETIVKSIMEKFAENDRLMVRSSSNCEDLETMAGAGLYESVACVAPAKAADAVRKVWASLWSQRAALSRKQAGIPHDRAHMAVLVQQMITSEYSFIMHTVNPVSGKNDEIYIEMAVGLGEILASGAVRGTPYRMICNKKTGALIMLAFADFSNALWPNQTTGVAFKPVAYSKIPLSNNTRARQKLARRLTAIGQFVEKEYGRPQDIEGCVVNDEIFLLQARPQQGINSTRETGVQP